MRAAITGATGFVGPHLCAHLDHRGRLGRGTRRRARRVRRHRPRGDRGPAAGAGTRRRISPRRALQRCRVVARSRRVPAGQRRGHAERARCCARRRRSARARGRQRGGVRHRRSRRPPVARRHVASVRSARTGRAKLRLRSSRCKRGSGAGSKRSVSDRSITPGRARAPRSSCPASPLASSRPNARARTPSSRDRSTRCATSPTCATSYARIACSCVTARPARSTTSAVVRACASPTSRPTSSPTPTRPCRVELDPGLVRPADIPVLVGDCTRLRTATGWRAEIPLADTLTAVVADVRERTPYGS